MRKDTNNLKFILTITPFLSKSNTKDWNLEETRDNGCTDTTDIVTFQFFRVIYICIYSYALFDSNTKTLVFIEIFT